MINSFFVLEITVNNSNAEIEDINGLSKSISSEMILGTSNSKHVVVVDLKDKVEHEFPFKVILPEEHQGTLCNVRLVADQVSLHEFELNSGMKTYDIDIFKQRGRYKLR